MATIFLQKTYRDVIRTRLEELKLAHGVKEYSFSKMAEVCGVQSTYLSKVFADRGHLNSDQLYQISNYLDFTDVEAEYVALLLEHERSGLHQRRLDLKQRINKLRDTNLQSEAALKSTVVDQAIDYSTYYYDVRHMLVHMTLMIDEYARHPKKIAEKLHISVPELEAMLAELEKLQLIVTEKGKVRVLQDAIHLPNASKLNTVYQKNMRLLAVNFLNNINKKNHHYAAIFSADEATKAKIKALFIDFMAEVEQLVKAARSEEIYVLDFDLFGIY